MKRPKFYCTLRLVVLAAVLLMICSYPSRAYADTDWSTYFTGYDYKELDGSEDDYDDYGKSWDATWPVTGTLEKFTTSPKDGYSFKCIRISPNGALIYSTRGFGNNFTVLSIPETVYDPYIGQNLQVVGLIAEAEIRDFEDKRSGYRWDMDFKESPFSYYPIDASRL